MAVDPKNWLINKAVGPARDATLGITVVDPPIDETGIHEVALFSEIKIGPNPTKAIVSITNLGEAQGTIKVFDLAGKQVMEKTLLTDIKIDLGSFASGIYVIKIYDQKNEERISQKLIKE